MLNTAKDTSISALFVSGAPAVFLSDSIGNVYYEHTPNGGSAWNFAALFGLLEIPMF
jgi:hypothetical protein